MNQLLISIIGETIPLYESGEYEVIKIQENQLFLFDPPGSVPLTDEDFILEMLNIYLLYQWHEDHGKTRHKKVLKEVYVPNGIKFNFKVIDFYEIMTLISGQTKDTL